MKLRGCWLIGLVLIAVLFTLSSGQVRRRQSRVTASPAKPGFYIQFDMCHACAYGGWQKDAVSALGRAGVQAFVSDDISSHYTEQSYWTLKSVRLRRVRNEGWPTPVYAGPFPSEDSDRQVFYRLPSILNPVFDEIGF
jgi:hypothetical protein